MKLIKIVTTLCIVVFAAKSTYAQTNIALGKKVTVSKPSNYALTKDKNPAQLTDGKYGGNSHSIKYDTDKLWVQPGAITWGMKREPVIITIDLEKNLPISGVALSTAAGISGVQFPSFVGIAVSEDNKTWHYQGNLISLSRKNGTPRLNGYTKFRFLTHDLQTKGRYVAIALLQVPYAVTDEIEVYSGGPIWLNGPIGGKELSSPTEMQDLAPAAMRDGFVQRRLDADIKTTRAVLETAALPTVQTAALQARLDEIAAKSDRMEFTGSVEKTTLPLNDEHRRVMAIYGELLAAQGVKPLSIWKQHRYAWLPLLAKPRAAENVSLDFSLLRNQFRSDAILLTNASGIEKTVRLQLHNPPAAASAGWLQIMAAVWMDTYQGIPVADALLPLVQNPGDFELTIPAGFTVKVWLTIDSSKLASGSYNSSLNVSGENVPLRVSVASTAMQRPRLSLGVWDYTDPKSMGNGASRGINTRNYPSAFNLMKSHYVDSAWAARGILPWPKASDYDSHDQLKTPLDFTNLDAWLSAWPHARHFFVYINAKEKATFAGAGRGTAVFNARLGNWAKALIAHLKSKEIAPERFSLLINDEPGLRGEWQDDVTADWARGLKAGAPELSLISDPVWKRPDLQKNQDAFNLMDMLMPNTQTYTTSVPEVEEYFRKHRESGKDLWLYACTGPVRLFNPQQYYRGQAWRVFAMGGKGMGFWAFGDIDSAPSSWHDYQISRSFTPAFVEQDTVYNSIHWEAVREGVQDFEELSMLRDAIENTTDIALKAQAEAVLKAAVRTVIATNTNDFWQLEKNPELADGQLQKVQAMLDKLKT